MPNPHPGCCCQAKANKFSSIELEDVDDHLTELIENGRDNAFDGAPEG
jgi:hypothetical protein